MLNKHSTPDLHEVSFLAPATARDGAFSAHAMKGERAEKPPSPFWMMLLLVAVLVLAVLGTLAWYLLARH